MSKFAVYVKHYKDDAEGHIFLDKSGACTITLIGAAAMPQNDLDRYGTIMAEALQKDHEQSKKNFLKNITRLWPRELNRFRGEKSDTTPRGFDPPLDLPPKLPD
jgi:hypothetical protein